MHDLGKLRLWLSLRRHNLKLQMDSLCGEGQLANAVNRTLYEIERNTLDDVIRQIERMEKEKSFPKMEKKNVVTHSC